MFGRSVAAAPVVRISCSYSSTISGIEERKSVDLCTWGTVAAVPVGLPVLECLGMLGLTCLCRCHIAGSTDSRLRD
jgi:hypothetical protein